MKVPNTSKSKPKKLRRKESNSKMLKPDLTTIGKLSSAKAKSEITKLEDIIINNKKIINSIFKSSHTLIVSLNKNGEIVSTNKKAEKFFGLKNQTEPIMFFKNSDWKILNIEGKSLPKSQNPFEQTKKTRKSVINSEIVISKNESERSIFSVNTYPFFDSNKNFSGSILFLLDITERKIAQEQLSEKEKYLDRIFNSVNDAIFILDEQNWEFSSVNKRAAELFGYSEKEITRLSPIILLAGFEPFTTDDANRYLRLAKTKGPQLFEWLAKNKNGEFFWVEVNIKYGFIGKSSKYFITVRDISERKKATEDLRLSENKYRQLVEFAPAGIFDLDYTTQKITSVNDAMCRFTGYNREELLEINGFKLLSEEGSKLFIQRQELISQGIVPDEIVDYEAVRKDGTKFWCQAYVRYIIENGKPIKANIVVLDISQRKVIENALKDSEERYEQLFEAESDAIFLIDNQTGSIIEANEAAVKLYGYSKSELLSLKNTDLSAQEDETRRITTDTPVMHDNVVLIPLRYHCKKDGTVFPVEITGRFFIRKERPVHIAAIRDISHRIEDEESKQEKIHRKQIQQNAIFEISSSQLTREGFLEPALKMISEKTSEILCVERASIWLLNEAGDEIRCIDLFEKSKNSHSTGTVIKGKDVPKYFNALKSVRTIDAGDAINDSRTSEFATNYLLPLGITSMLDVPIRASGRLTGILCSEHTGQPRKWLDDEINFVNQIADQISQTFLNHEKSTAQEALRISEDRLNMALNAVDEAIWEWIPGKDLLYWSPKYITLLGYKENEIKPSVDNWIKLIHPDFVDEAQISLKHCLDNLTDDYKQEILFKTKDGSFKWIMIKGKVIERNTDGTVARMLGTHTDITEQKLYEEALTIKDAAISSSIAAIAITDLKGSINYVNNSFLNLWGFSSSKGIIGRNTTEFWSDAGKIMDVIIELTTKHKWVGELMAKRKDGSLFLAEVSASIIKNKKGAPIGMMMSFLDITEQKQVLEFLKFRMEFESLINKISNSFIHLQPEEIDSGLNRALMEIGKFTGVDRAYIFRLYDNYEKMDNTHEWCENGIVSFIKSLQNLDVKDFPLVYRMIEELKEVYIENVSNLPADSLERAEFENEGIQSLLLVPMKSAGKIIGFLGLDSVLSEKTWDNDTILLLNFIGEIFANAIEKVRYEGELKTFNQRLNDIIEFIPDATFVIDQNKKVIAWNRAIESMTGVNKKDIIGKGEFEYALPFFNKRRPLLIDLLDVPNEKLEAKYKSVKRVDDKIFAESYIPGLYDNRGAYLWGVAAPLYDKDGNRSGSIEVIKDVSDIKRKEIELSESEERFRIVLEQTGIIVYDIDKEKNLIHREGAIESILGYSKEEYQNLSIDEWMKLVHPDDIQNIIDQENEAAQSNPKFTSTYRVRRKDGEYITIEENGYIQKDKDDKVIRILGSMKDTTEKVRRENALRVNEERLRHALEGATDGIWDMNLKTLEIYLSPRYYNILEFEPGDFEPSIEAWKNLIHPDDMDRITAIIMSNLSIESPTYAVEFRMKTKSGNWKWISTRGKLVECDSNNKPLRITGTISDITERKIADNALRESEERYQTLANTSPVGIFRADAQGNTIYVNPKWCEISGLSEIEGMGNKWIKAIHPDDLEYATKSWQKAFSEKKISISEYRFLRADGKITWVYGQANPLFNKDNNLIGYVGTILDITDRKNAELSLHESLKRQNLIIQSLPILFYSTEVKAPFKTKWMDGNIEEITGFDQEYFTSDSSAWSSRIHPDDIDSVLPRYNSILEEENISVEYRWKCKDGNYKWFLDETVLIKHSNGRPKEVIGIWMDITERKKTEELINKSEEKYRELIETMPNGFYRTTPEGKFVDVNPAFVNMLGYDNKEELMSVNIPDALYVISSEREDTHNENPEFIDKTEIYRLKRKDGGIIWLEDNARYIKDESGKVIFNEGICKDITEKRKAEEEIKNINSELKKNLAFTEALMEAIPTPVFFKDNEGKYIGCNKAFSDQLGVTTEEIQGKTVFELWPGENAKVYHQKDLELLLNPHLQVYEFQIKDKFGEVRDTVYAKNVFKDETGKNAGIVGSYIDITDRKKAEEALRASEEKYRTLFSNTALAVGLRALDGSYLEFNEAYSRMVGYSLEELKALRSENYTHSDDIDITLSNMQKIVSGEADVVRYEKRYLNKDGSIVWGNVCLQPLKSSDGKILSILGTISDITDRKIAEDALKESEEKYRMLAENVTDVLWTMDFNFKVLYISPSTVRMHGWTPEEWYNLPPDKFLPADSLKSTQEILLKEIQDLSRPGVDKNKSVSFEIEQFKKDGSKFWTEINSRLLFDLDGKPIGIIGISRDISERKKADEALAASEERYRLLIEHTPDAIVVHSGGKVIFANNATVNLMRAKDINEIIGLPVMDFVHPDYREAIIERIKKMSSTNQPAPISEEKFIRLDGSEITVEVTAIPFIWNGVQAFQTIFRDISARKESELALIQSEEQFRMLFENSPVGIGVADFEGKILAFNSAMIEPGNYSTKMAESITNVLELYHDVKQHFDVLNKFKEHGFVRDYPVQLKRVDGSAYDALLSLIHTVFKGQKCIQAIVVDITERKKNEEEIKLINSELTILNKIITDSISHNKKEEILNNLIDDVLAFVGLEGGTICTIDEDDTFKLTVYRGTSEETITDLTNNKIKVGECLCGNCAKNKIPLVLNNRNEVLDYTTRESQRGEEINFLAAFPIMADTNCFGVLCVFTRTDKKPLERHLKLIETITSQIAIAIEKNDLYEQVQKQAEQLEIKIKERTSALEASNKELENFSYSVSHDLRAPLRAIDGFSLALFEDYNDIFDVQAKTYLNRIRVNSQKMAILIDDLLGMARVTRVELERDRVNLSHIINEVFYELTEFQKERIIHFELEKDLFDFVDRQLIRICFQNLLENALKFSSQKEITKISVGAIQIDNKKVYFISDNGVGFDMKYYSKLFGVFQRLHTHDEFPGSGVGLAIVQKIIHKHNGKIWAESNPGSGATFFFTLNEYFINPGIN
ncbi:MAG: PAS domain S-box protein [bacterium]